VAYTNISTWLFWS